MEGKRIEWNEQREREMKKRNTFNGRKRMNSILHKIGSFGKKKQAEKIHIFLIWNITHIFPPLEARNTFF